MRKYILMFIICVSSFMIYTNNVNAESIDVGSYSSSSCPLIDGWYTCTGELGANTFHTIQTRYINGVINSKINKGSVLHFYSFIATNSNNASVPNIDIYQNGTGSIIKVGEGELMPYDIDSIDFSTNPFTITLNKDFVFSFIFQYATSVGSNISQQVNCSALDSNGFIEWTCPIQYDIPQNANINLRMQFYNYISQNYKIYIKNIYNIQITDTSIISNNTTTINNNTTEIKNELKDSSIDNNNATGTINNLSGQLASDSTITSLLLLPINFINVLIDGLSGDCVPYSLGELWGSEIVLPCVNLYNTFGAIWYMVDTGLSALVIFKMSKYFIRLFNKLTNLKDGGLEEAYS